MPGYRSGHSRFRFRKQFSFETEDILLLPPHSMWYPAPGLVRGSNDPGLENWFFATHRLTVHTDAGLTALAQGRRLEISPGEFTFTAEDPLPGVTLAVGLFKSRSAEVDSVTYSLSTLCPDDYFMPFFENAEYDPRPDRRAQGVGRLAYRPGISVQYRFAIVEVPAGLYCFPRPLVTNSREYCQPGMVMAPERAYNWPDSYIYYLHQKRWKRLFRNREEDPRSDTARTFIGSMRGSLLDAGMYVPLSSYYSGVIHIGSIGYSTLDHAVESHFGSRIDHFLDIDNKYNPGTGDSPGRS